MGEFRIDYAELVAKAREQMFGEREEVATLLRAAIERITQLEMELSLEERDSWHRRDVLKYVGPVIAAAREIPYGESVYFGLYQALQAYDKRVEEELGE